jgi:Domain of unknown function (DUF6468)
MTSLYLIPIAQIVLAIALFLVAVLCLRLEKRLSALREGKDGIAQAAAELSQAVGRAEASVAALRQTSEDAARDLQQRIEEARAASEALKFLSTTARAMEPRGQVDQSRAPVGAAERSPARSALAERSNQWDEDDFRPSRREPATSRWGGLR